MKALADITENKDSSFVMLQESQSEAHVQFGFRRGVSSAQLSLAADILRCHKTQGKMCYTIESMGLGAL